MSASIRPRRDRSGIAFAAYTITPACNAADFIELAENFSFLDRKQNRALNETVDGHYRADLDVSDGISSPEDFLQRAVRKGLDVRARIVRDDVAVADQSPFVDHQTFHPHRSAGVDFAGADANLGP